MTNRQIEQLLQHDEFLRRFVCSLVHDATQADDIVQETWLAVLRSKKSAREIHPGWLAGIARNLSRRKLREESRRSRRETIAARPDVSDPDCPLEHADAQRRLAIEVLALPARYRKPMLLRFYEGCEPAQIAEQLGLSPSTVRTQLQRGLAMMRRNLKGAVLGLAAVFAPLRTARARRIWFATATVAVTLLALVVSQPSEGGARGGTGRALAVANRSMLASVPRGTQTLSVESSTADDPSIEVAAAYALSGTVQLPNGLLTARATIEISAPGLATPVRVMTSEKYTASLDPLFAPARPAFLLVRVSHPECVPVERRIAANAMQADFVLLRRPELPEELMVAAADTVDEAEATEKDEAESAARGLTKEVQTDVRAGAPRHVLTGRVSLPPGLAPEPIVLAVCAEERCLRFRVSPDRVFRLDVGKLFGSETPTALTIRASSRNTLPAARTVPVYSGQSLEAVQFDLELGRLVRGRVTFIGRSGADRVADRATVAVVSTATGKPLHATLTDATGAFEVVVPTVGEYVVLSVASGWLPAVGRPVDAMVLALRRGATIGGSVNTARGPVAGVEVGVTAIGVRPSRLMKLASGTLTWTNAGPQWLRQRARTNGDGEFAVGGLRVRTYRVSVGEQTRDVDAPGVVEFVPRADAFTVSVTAMGAPVADARVETMGTTRLTDIDGLARFNRLLDAPLKVRVEAEGYRAMTGAAQSGSSVHVALVPDGDVASLAIRLVGTPNVPFLSSARVRLVAMPSKKLIHDASVRIVDNTIRIADLAPGAVRIMIQPGGWYFPLEATTILGAGRLNELKLRPIAGGRVEAEAVDAVTDARVAADLSIAGGTRVLAVAQRAVGDTKGVLDVKGGIGAGGLLAVKRYEFSVVPRKSLWDPAFVVADVRAGETTRVRVRLARTSGSR